MVSLQQIFGWFKRGFFPTEDQYKQTFSSFRHKSEKIEQTAILGLNDELNARATNNRVDSLENTVSQKVDRSELDNLIGGMLPQGEVATTDDLPTDPAIVKTGYSYIVINEKEPESGLSYIYVAEIVTDANDVKTVAWKNTKLTKYPSDVATKTDVAVKANITDLPNNPNDETITYTKPDFSQTTETGGDTGSVWYANDVSKVTQAGALKGIVIKTTAAGVAKVKAISVDINGSNVSYKDLHTYTDISVEGGENTYNIDDNFILPVGSYIAVTFSAHIGYYSSTIGVSSIRIIGTTAELSTVNIAYRIITTGVSIASDLLTKEYADRLYLKENQEPIELWEFVNNIGYIGKDGVIASTDDTNWRYSDLIPFYSERAMYIKAYGHKEINTLSFYDSNGDYIGGYGYDGMANHGLCQGQVVSPIRTAYIKICGADESYQMALPYAPFYVNYYSDLVRQVEQLETDVDQLRRYEALKDYWADYVTLTGYIGTNGQIASASDTNWQRSDFINFSEDSALDIRCYGHMAVNTVSFYDENKIYLSGIAASQNGTFESVVTSPAGTRFIKLSGGSDTYIAAQSSKPFRAINNISILTELNSLQYQINNISKTELTVNRKQVKLNLTGLNVFLHGDSISSTDYKWYKEALEALMGANVYNGGFSGRNTAYLASDAALQRMFDFNPHLIISLVGGNDTGQVVGTFGAIAGEPLVTETDINVDYNGTYFIQAVSHIIRKVKARYYNIRERANLTGFETPAEMEAKIDAVLKPYFVFCTTLPQKRNDENNAFSNPENWARKRNAVLECCIKYDVHCIDLFNLVGWDMSLEPFWISPTSMTNNRGIYTMDGLHPNKYGYQQMASIVCGELGII